MCSSLESSPMPALESDLHRHVNRPKIRAQGPEPHSPTRGLWGPHSSTASCQTEIMPAKLLCQLQLPCEAEDAVGVGEEGGSGNSPSAGGFPGPTRASHLLAFHLKLSLSSLCVCATFPHTHPPTAGDAKL